MIKAQLDRQRDPNQQIDNPVVFLAGALRSGTTLLRLMLDGHSKIRCPGEFDFIADSRHELGPNATVEQHWDNLERKRIFRDYGFTKPNASNYHDFVRNLIAQISEPGETVVLPIHRRFEYLQEIVPNSRFIHLVRDPRDVAYSVIAMGWAGNVWHGSECWLGTETSWKHTSGSIAADAQTMVRFEDLVREPEKTLGHLCEFMGFEFDPGMLQVDDRSTYKPPSGTFAHKWQKKKNEREIELIEHRSRPLMEEFGYKPVSQPISRPGSLTLLGLRIQDKFARLRFNSQRYSFKTIALEKLSRWFKCNGLHDRIQRQMDQTESQHLK
ncbi:MAG: sulfotransferase [Planctomycetales bacterium]|nr:sulfotransferase [Planctomycetales bacterium]